MRTSKAIDRVIDACIDDERMLEHESRFVRGHRRDLLARLAVEQAVFVGRLQGLGFGRGGDRLSHPRSWTELAREVGRLLRVIAGGRSDSDSVAACRRSCIRTEAPFDKALELPWPGAVREALVEQRAHLDGARNALIAIQY